MHLSGRDIDKAVLKKHGIINEHEEENSRFITIYCPRCKTQNSPGSKFCSNCSLGLDVPSVKAFEKTRDEFTINLVEFLQDKAGALQTLNELTKLLQKQ